MKTCEYCFKGQANILYYDAQGGRSRQIHLCQACATAKGFDALPGFGEESRIALWKAQLEVAISTEAFEEAARLRDLINHKALAALR